MLGSSYDSTPNGSIEIVCRVHQLASIRKGHIMKLIKAAALGASLFFIAAASHAGETYDAVKKKGFVQCGVHTGLPGFSIADSKGQWTGIDVDVCRGIAAIVRSDERGVGKEGVSTCGFRWSAVL